MSSQYGREGGGGGGGGSDSWARAGRAARAGPGGHAGLCGQRAAGRRGCRRRCMSTGWGTRRVRLVRGEGRGVSTWYEGGGGGGGIPSRTGPWLARRTAVAPDDTQRPSLSRLHSASSTHRRGPPSRAVPGGQLSG